VAGNIEVTTGSQLVEVMAGHVRVKREVLSDLRGGDASS
jgi:hypothetical protein